MHCFFYGAIIDKELLEIFEILGSTHVEWFSAWFLVWFGLVSSMNECRLRYSAPPTLPKLLLKTKDLMAIWSAMPTSFLGAFTGSGAGSSFFASLALGAGS